MSNAYCEDKKAIDTLKPGEVLEVQVTDKGALADIPAWAKAGGHIILDQSEEVASLHFHSESIGLIEGCLLQ